MKRFCYCFVALLVAVVCLALVGCKENEPVVEKVTVESISIVKEADKKVFDAGEKFNSDGLKVQKDLSDKTHKELTTDEYTIDSTSYKENEVGTYEIIITYKEDTTKTCKYSVTVRKVNTLTVTTKVTDILSTEYYPWYDESYGLVATLKYSDGTVYKTVSGEDLVTEFTMSTTEEQDEFSKMLGLIPSDLGEQSYTLTWTKDVNVKATVKYKVYDEEELNPAKIVITKMPSKTVFGSVSDIDVYDIEVGLTYKECGERIFDYYMYDIYIPDDIGQTGDIEIIVYTEDQELSTSFNVNVVDISDYTFDSIRISDDSSYRNLFFKDEEDAMIDAYNIIVEKVYKKDGCEDIVLEASYFEVSSDGVVNTNSVGKQTFTIIVEDKKVEFEVEVVEFKFDDGIYLKGFEELGFGQVYFKVVDGKVYLYKDGEFETLETETKGYTCNKDFLSDRNVLTVYVEYEEIIGADFGIGYGVSYYIDGKDLELTEDYKLVEEEDIVYVESELDIYEGSCLVKEDGKISEEQLDALSVLGNLYLDEAGTQQVTADTNVTGNVVYLIFTQEDYTGKPFLGTYEYEGIDTYTIEATKIIVYDELEGDMELGYSAIETEEGWEINASGITFIYDNDDKTLTLDLVFYQMVLTKKN